MNTNGSNGSGMDFLLLRMPYSATTQPALATGLLKACLDRAGLINKVIPANIAFAEEIGPVVHNLLFTSVPQTMIGEWTFSQTLFPDFTPPDEKEYLDRVVAYLKVDESVYWRELCRSYPYLDIRKLLYQVRERAKPFIDQVANQVIQYSPRIVGCTSVFQQHCASLAVLRRLKELRPSIVTMIGGANCEGSMGRATFEKFLWLDYVVSGDADGFIGPFCQDILNNQGFVPAERLPTGVYSRAEPTDRVRGPLTWTPERSRPRTVAGSNDVDRLGVGAGNGHTPHPVNPAEPKQALLAVLTNRSAEEQSAPIAALGDLDEVPVPNYDDWFQALGSSKLGSFIYPSLPYMTSRGCWWGQKHHCTFCGISKEQMQYRAKSADVVMAELLAMKEKYGINSFQGTEYILDQQYFKTLIPQLHQLESHFRFEVKANLKSEHIRALRDAGVVEIQPGIESLQDDILRLLDKGTTAALNVRILKAGVEHGMSIFWNMLHSVPGDRDEWYQEQADLLPLLHHLQPPTAFAAIHYDRFSVYWERPEDFGLQLVPAWGYQHVYPFNSQELLELAYFFDNCTEMDKVFGAADGERPGLRALTVAMGTWQKQFRRLDGNERPVLALEEFGDHTVVTDTRNIAVARTTKLDGLALHVIKACDVGVAQNGLMRALSEDFGNTLTWEHIMPVLDDLIDRKLLVKLSNRYFALPIMRPVRQYAVDECDDPELYPDAGLIHADRALAGETLARTCVRSAYDTPVTELFTSLGKTGVLESRTVWSP